jgi:hypothetical protein
VQKYILAGIADLLAFKFFICYHSTVDGDSLGFLAVTSCESRQVRKEAAAALK